MTGRRATAAAVAAAVAAGGVAQGWETTENGLTYPGARIGHTDPVRPSAGGARYEAFTSRHIKQSKGRWRGRALQFYPEQSGFHHELFRTVDGRRLYTEALYGIPRKNGKSTDVAALALYLLLADGEPAPEVYGAAGSRQQAHVVFQEAARMVRASPVLSEWCKVYRNEIVVPSIDGVYRAVSAEGGLQMGSNPSGVVIDELHVLKGDAGRELYYALTTGMDAREQPLIISITTAGYELDSIGREVYDRMLGARADIEDDDNPYADDGRSLMWWLGAIEGDDTSDPDVWMRANPAPWITKGRLGAKYRKLPRPVFERLHLNLWTTTEALWLPPDAWANLKSDARVKPGERVWLGVDIGFKRDASAVVMVARRDGEGPGGKALYVTQAWTFDPALQADGSLDMAPVENRIRELAAKHRVVACRYDRTLFQRSAEELSETVRMEEQPWSSNQRVVEWSQALYELIVEQRLTHDGDTTFAAHVNAGVVRETESGWRVSKQKSKRRIDALAALLMAIGGAVDKRTRAEPGARPIPSGGQAPRGQAAAATADAKLAAAAVERVRGGGIVGDLTRAQYEDVVRPALHELAASSADTDELYVRLALAEVKRLDAVHALR